MYDIIIIGAGPAGLTSAIYARRNLKKTLVIEKRSYGGQIINTLNIENYPAEDHISGFDWATKTYNQAKNFETEFVFEEVMSIKNGKDFKEVVTNKNTYQTKTIIIATGLENRKLSLDNEQNLIGKGVSYCATCDGTFYKDKDVAVVGGGNTALEDALYLSNIANKVYLIHRRDEFRGENTVTDKIRNINNIECIYNSRITKLNASDTLESIEIIDKDNNFKTIPVSGLFIAIGHEPQNKIFENIVNLNSEGYIIASENCHTNIAGIFVAGDNRVKEIRQLVTATSDGAIAATEAIKYINNLK